MSLRSSRHLLCVLLLTSPSVAYSWYPRSGAVQYLGQPPAAVTPIATAPTAQPAANVAPPATGLCVKDTSRSCRSWNRGSINEHVTQCIAKKQSHPFLSTGAADVDLSKNESYCSADIPPVKPRGTCICGPDYCADTDLLCHRGNYQEVNDVFTISSKLFPEEKLFMTADGKVSVGTPPDPRAAQWRISVTRSGVKILRTELYTNTILQEYESCTSITDAFGLSFTKCARLVGNVADPQAGEMGWMIEMYGDKGQTRLGVQPQALVQLRSASSWKMFYISPETKEGLACEDRGRNCPGDAGAFQFDPPIVGRSDLSLDYAPGEFPPGLAAYASSACMAAILILCLACVFSRDSRTMGSCASCILVPFREVARAFNLSK